MQARLMIFLKEDAIVDECPVQGKCLQAGVVYQATINRQDGIVKRGTEKTYILKILFL